jgi:AraC-like DNA-binding protein
MLGLVYMIGEPLVGQTPTMLNLNLSYPAPTHAHKYRALFDCPIRFSASKTTLEVSREWFDGPIRTYDGEFNSICLKHCESMFLRIDGAKPISAALRNVFAQFTDRPLPSLEQSAKALRLAPRTLRRRLHDEGTNFRRQIDDYRSEQAKKLFSYGTVSPKEAAYLLGFKEHSAFRHAFKGWTGQTISEYRAKMAASR